MPKAAIENKNSDWIPAILVGAWALALLIVFFEYRGNDVGKLQSLIGNLGGGRWFGLSGFGESVAGLTIAVLIGIGWFGLGNLATFLIGDKGEDRTPGPLAIVRN